jgi:hypothetical protein
MNEQDYERLVERLEQRWDNRLLEIAVAYIGRDVDISIGRTADTLDPEEQRENARLAVEKTLFDHADWEPVKATDISDIAYEYAEKAWSQVQAWKEN